MLDKWCKNVQACQKCKNLKKKNQKDCSLINIFEDLEFGKQIPSIWTDWYERRNAKIMVIGQDWGPFCDMERLQNLYQARKDSKNWNELIASEKSSTKKMFTKYFVNAAEEVDFAIEDPETLKQVYFTNAILCARKRRFLSR